jgi:hypothetical protein
MRLISNFEIDEIWLKLLIVGNHEKLLQNKSGLDVITTILVKFT